jgi:hypothetical protein
VVSYSATLLQTKPNGAGPLSRLENEIKKFMDKFNPSTLEYVYFQRVFEILGSLNLPQEMESGMACMTMLEYCAIEFDDGLYINNYDDYSLNNLSLTEMGLVMSLFFEDVENNPAKWRSNYMGSCHKPNEKIMKMIADKLRALPAIKKVSLNLSGRSM